MEPGFFYVFLFSYTSLPSHLKAILYNCLFAQTLRYEENFILGISNICTSKALVPVVRVILAGHMR